MSAIDLRKHGQLDHSLKFKFEEVLEECIDPFHKFIEDISIGVSDNIDWWVSTPASRDTLYSNLFHNFTILFFIKRLIKEKTKFHTIIIDDIYLKEIILEFFEINNKEISILVEDEGKYQVSLIRNLYEVIRFHFLFFIKLVICKLLIRRKIKKASIPNGLILIDTFFIYSFRKKERYFDGLLDNLTKEDQENIYFVPSLIEEKITDLYRSVKYLKSKQDKYLLKEEFIKFKDLIFTFCYFFRKNKIKFKKVKVLGCSFYKLVNAELLYLNRFLMSIEGLLSYRFVKNLNKKGIGIKRSINWFENQPMDKGWNLGFNSFYKNSNNVGYRGLVPANYFLSQKYVTDFEFENKVTPRKIYTVGDNKGLEADRFTEKTQFVAGPSFRFKYLWDELKRDKEAKNQIFVALPITLDQSILIMEAINSLNSDLRDEKIKFLIKAHPAMQISLLLSNLSFSISKNMTFTSEDVSLILMKSSLIIAGMSSICLEACAVGVPLVVFNSSGLVKFNSLPNNISKEIWRDVSNHKDLYDEVKFFLNMDQSHEHKISSYSKQVKKNNFNPVNHLTVTELLNL